MTDTNGPDEDEQTVKDSLNPKVRRRDVMKAAGAAGVISSVGATGVSAAQSDCECVASEPQGSSCFDSVGEDCTFCKVEDVPSIGETCTVTIDDNTITFEGADSGDGDDETECIIIREGGAALNRVALKSGRGCECTTYTDVSNGDKLCTLLDDGSQCHKQISHLEFEVCPQPRVAGLSADCSTLTIETANTEDGDTLTVDYRLQLVDSEGNVLEEPVDADGVTTTVNGDDGTATIDLGDDTDDSWNRVAIDEVIHEDGTDMLAEAGLSKPQTRDTPTLCNPPFVSSLAADCSTLTIDTEHAAGDTISVDYRLQLVDSDGNVTRTNVASATDAEATVGSDGVATITVSDHTPTDDPWNRVAFDEVVHDQTGTDMLAEAGLSKPQTRDTPTLCNPPSVIDLATDCGGMLDITTDNVPDGDDLLVDYTLEFVDADCTSTTEIDSVTDATATVNGGVATVDLTEGGTVTGWNVVEVTSVVHDASDAEMLDAAERLIVTVI